MDGERMNTQGFYKNENGILLYSSTTVESAAYLLIAEQYAEYNYPIDGWYWFDNEEEARIFFNLGESQNE
jgi:hypothetical protein